MRAHDNRIARVRRAIDAAPVRYAILREAYEWFTGFGELPDEDRVADAVLQRAMRGGAEAPKMSERERLIILTVERHKPPGAGPQLPTVREALFSEAMDENPYLRQVARAAIALEVSRGGNVEDAGFVAHHGLPKHNCVALHVIGFPLKWVRPPYEEQAARLFAREDELRERIPQDDPTWFAEQADVVVEFLQTGALPDDELRRDVLLAHIEMDAIIAHKQGRDVGKAMGLLDWIATGDDQVRAGALSALCELAKAGRLFPPRSDA